MPPPDEEFPKELPVDAHGVKVHLVGIIVGDPSAEVLATDGTAFFRFELPRHARVVRKFLRSIGVVDMGALDGAYESAEGFGPLRLVGLAVGRDSAPEGETGAIVLTNVRTE